MEQTTDDNKANLGGSFYVGNVLGNTQGIKGEMYLKILFGKQIVYIY